MARRTLMHSSIRAVFKGMQHSPSIPLDDVGGIGLLELFNSWAQPGLDLSNSNEQIHTAIDQVAHYKRATLVHVSTGSWGDTDRRLVDHTGERDPRTIDADDAATDTTRALLIVPPKAEVGLWFVERQGNSAGGSRIWRAFESVVEQAPRIQSPRGGQRVVRTKRATVTLGSDWATTAELQEVSVRKYEPASEAGDPDNYHITDMVHENRFRPKKRKTNFPPRLRDRLLRATDLYDAASLFGITETDADLLEDVSVRMTDGRQEKTFEIFSPAGPTVLEVLNEHGQPAISPAKFLEECAHRAQHYYENILQTFDHAWMRPR